MKPTPTTTRGRLALYRAQAGDARNTYATAKDWRYWKRSTTSTPSNVRGPGGKIYTDNRDQYGVDLALPRDVAGLLSGWYADGFQYATIRGSVCRIRGARFTQYVPVTSHSDWDGTVHHMADAVRVPRGSPDFAHEDATREAAGLADRCAELEAEQAVEDWEKDQREQAVQEARERIHALNQEALPLLRAIKDAAGALAAPICDALRDRLDVMLEDRAQQFAVIEGD